MRSDSASKASHDDEFPLLRFNGLYASEITGDGDCLFHALSDQLYGHESNHQEIRSRVVSHMRGFSSYFKSFLDVEATVASSSSRRNKGKKTDEKYTPAPESVVNEAFEAHVNRMSKRGVYGDNMEICAFAREYDCDVKIYQRDFAYVVVGGELEDSPSSKPGSPPRRLLHIAYHTWEHYSSVRNVAGPHTGPPDVTLAPVTIPDEQGNRKRSKGVKEAGYTLPWMVKTVVKSLPYLADEERIRKTLEECKGNINEAVSRLLDEEYVEEEDGVESSVLDGKQVSEEKKEEEAEKQNKVEDVNEGIVAGVEDEAKNCQLSIPSSKADASPPKDMPASANHEGVKGVKTTQNKKQDKKGGKKKQSNIESETGSPNEGAPNGKQDAHNNNNSNNSKVPKKPKRETARERKERQKQAAKERKKGSKPTADAPSPAAYSEIKEVYI